MNKYYIYNKVKDMHGWLSQDKCSKMCDLIIDTKPLVCVEIGVFGGKSLAAQALALKENGSGIIYGIDPWKTNECLKNMTDEESISWWQSVNLNDIYVGCKKFIKENNLNEYVSLHRTTSREAEKLFSNSSIDILHIDGNHEEESSCYDVINYYPKVKRGGYIWLDDADWTQVRKARDIIENKFKCKLIEKAASQDPTNFCNLYQKQ